MAKTKSLALTTTYQDITVSTVCQLVTVKEDESVANYPTVSLKFRRSSSDTADDVRTAGKSVFIRPAAGRSFQPSDVVGQIAVTTGSTTGIQDEE